MATNTQKPVSVEMDPEGRLRVHSVFATLQGEGPWAGQCALFVRLHGCNLQCPGCDTDYTSMMRRLGPGELVAELLALDKATPLVVITGGEPLAQNLCPFIEQCQQRLPQARVQIETNGSTFSPELERGFGALAKPPDIVCSPKLDRVEPRLLPFIGSFKYIVGDGGVAGDGLPEVALGHPVRNRLFRPDGQTRRRMAGEGRIFLQAEDTGDERRNRRHTQACVDAVQRHRLRLSTQLHKQLDLP